MTKNFSINRCYKKSYNTNKAIERKKIFQFWQIKEAIQTMREKC